MRDSHRQTKPNDCTTYTINRILEADIQFSHVDLNVGTVSLSDKLNDFHNEKKQQPIHDSKSKVMIIMKWENFRIICVKWNEWTIWIGWTRDHNSKVQCSQLNRTTNFLFCFFFFFQFFVYFLHCLMIVSSRIRVQRINDQNNCNCLSIILHDK